jgi:large subunit ribosomal protein L21e
MTKVPRAGRSNPITRKIQKFEQEDIVHIIIDPSIHKGQPHPRFHGKTAKVVGEKGKAYILSLNDGNKAKEVIVRPEHLQRQE